MNKQTWVSGDVGEANNLINVNIEFPVNGMKFGTGLVSPNITKTFAKKDIILIQTLQ